MSPLPVKAVWKAKAKSGSELSFFGFPEGEEKSKENGGRKERELG